jgi:hypothetical protein
VRERRFNSKNLNSSALGKNLGDAVSAIAGGTTHNKP